MHPADQTLERRHVRRRRQRAAENMTIDVELLVLDPAWTIDVERRVRELPGQHRSEMQTPCDHRLHVLEEVAAIILRQLEDRHAADMHRHLRRLHV